MGHGFYYLSFLLNTHVAQFVRIELGQEQVRPRQDDEQNYNCACNNVHGCLLSYLELTQFAKGFQASPIQLRNSFLNSITILSPKRSTS